MRFATLALLFTALACNDDAPDPVHEETTSRPAQAEPPEAAPAVTGTRVYQRDAEAIAEDLLRLEKQAAAFDEEQPGVDALARFEREVRMMLRQIDTLLEALAVNIKAESRQLVEQRSVALRQRQGALLKEKDGLHREMVEVERILEAHRVGGDELPPGFTADELQDKLDDLQARMDEKDEALEDVGRELESVIELREAGEVPEQGETALTRERAVFQRLRERAEKLLPSR